MHMQMVSALFNHIPALKSINENSKKRLIQCACCQMALLRGSYRYQIERFDDETQFIAAQRFLTKVFDQIFGSCACRGPKITYIGVIFKVPKI